MCNTEELGLSVGLRHGLIGAGLCILAASSPLPLHAQGAATGLEVGALPALNYDADEGFGYGALAELYQYGDGTAEPYRWTLQPTVFLTTEGRRDVTVFFDGPAVLPDPWRFDVFVGSEKQIATPYYGVGNNVPYDETLDRDDGPNPYFYRFGRTRRSVTFNVQRGLGDTRVRALMGGGVVRTTAVPVPDGEGTTLYEQHVGAAETAGWYNYLRIGLIWDSRDRETGPRRGAWTEILLQRVDETLGSESSFTRWTVTDRRYIPLGERWVLAHRYLLQGVSEGAPLHELHRVQTSFKQQEGLGGAKTLRGVLKNRFVGRGMLVWNVELRWRVAEFRLLGRSFHTVVSGFLDQGRVWEEGPRVDELLRDLHRGFGGGVRLGMGENFVVAVDAGTSEETGLTVYVGLGYPF